MNELLRAKHAKVLRIHEDNEEQIRTNMNEEYERLIQWFDKQRSNNESQMESLRARIAELKDALDNSQDKSKQNKQGMIIAQTDASALTLHMILSKLTCARVMCEAVTGMRDKNSDLIGVMSQTYAAVIRIMGKGDPLKGDLLGEASKTVDEAVEDLTKSLEKFNDTYRDFGMNENTSKFGQAIQNLIQLYGGSIGPVKPPSIKRRDGMGGGGGGGNGGNGSGNVGPRDVGGNGSNPGQPGVAAQDKRSALNKSSSQNIIQRVGDVVQTRFFGGSSKSKNASLGNSRKPADARKPPPLDPTEIVDGYPAALDDDSDNPIVESMYIPSFSYRPMSTMGARYGRPFADRSRGFAYERSDPFEDW